MNTKRFNERELSNQLFHLNISEELYAMRDKFCPSAGKFLCDPQCPIFSKYVATDASMSCNRVLNDYPEDCKKIFKNNPRGVIK